MIPPKSIATFEMLFWISLVLSVVDEVLFYPQLATKASSALIFEVYGVLALTSLFNIAIALFISRRGSEIAKWIFILMLVPAILSWKHHLDLPALGLLRIISLVSLLVQFVAIYLLFVPESKEWFASKKNT